MHRFNIFIKSKKFHWDADWVVTAIMLIILLVYLINSNVSHSYIHQVDKYIGLSAGLAFIGAVIRKFSMLNKPEKINGILEGFLEFQNDFIMVAEQKINLDAIKKIEISNNDYYGKAINGRGFCSPFSAGVENQLKIFLKDNSKIEIMFEIYNKYDMEKVDDVLISYAKNGILELDSLKEIFKMNSRQFKDLKTQIKAT